MPATAVILAAGLGTRMSRPCRRRCTRSPAGRCCDTCWRVVRAAFDQRRGGVGPDMEAVASRAAPHRCVVQHERLGTAHAALQAAPQFGAGEVAVLYADNPLIRPETLRRLLDRRRARRCGLALLAMRPADPGRYGRVIVQRRLRRADRRVGRRHGRRAGGRPVQCRRAVRRRRRNGALAGARCAPTTPRANIT